MKQLLLSVLAFFVVPSVFSQNFEVGVNGGAIYNNAPSGIHTQGFWDEPSEEKIASTTNPCVSVKAMYNYKKWQLGIDAGYRTIKYDYSFYQDGFAGYFLTYKTTKAEPVIPVKLFVARKFIYHRLESYCGISAGYVAKANNKEITIYSVSYPHRYSFIAGIEGGTTYFISKKIGINAEIRADYMPLVMGEGNNTVKGKLFNFPATIGIRYKL